MPPPTRVHGTITLCGAPFQEDFCARATAVWPIIHNSADRFGLSAPHFARRYYGDHCCFLFLRLMICLSSAGGRPRLRPRSHCILADGAPSDGCGDAYGPSRGIGTETWACNTRKLASTQVAFKVLVLRLIVQCIRVIACRRVLHRLGSQEIGRASCRERV